MIPQEFKRMYDILASFLGEAKNGFSENLSFEFPCPHCVEKYGTKEIRKYNLSLSLSKQLFQCWKCASEGDETMKGSVYKLIKLYGNDELYREYKECINSIKNSKLYDINFSAKYKNIDLSGINQLDMPNGYVPFDEKHYYPRKAIEYLTRRGINWSIIHDFSMGFTTYQEDNKTLSNRIILPSFNKFGELNYWTGRDFTNNDKRQKYFNPKVERKDIIFDEEKIQWDADITLVEGPFDHIVVPNSIPLLGKSLSKEYKLYWELFNKANAKINIFLDGDAFESVLKIYKTLNHDRLYGKVRYIPVNSEYDPSLLFQLGGNKTIINHLKNAVKINEVYLN